jgi:hypothetical protein
MDQKSKHNPRRKFDAVQEQALGIYVYVLWDPRDSKAFYVGMGAGSRVFDHFNEVENLGSELWKSKHRRIADIWAEDLEVRWSIIRRNLGDENCAADVEAAVIDALESSQNGITLNEVRGQGVRLHGSLSEEEVAALAAIPVDPEYNYNAVFLFPIQSTLAQGRSVYDATRIAWPISNEYRTLANGMAVGIAGGISRGVFTIEQWETSNSVVGRQEFRGAERSPHELLNKSWLSVLGRAMGYWQRGNYLVIEMNGKGGFRFRRGSQEKEAWLPLKD